MKCKRNMNNNLTCLFIQTARDITSYELNIGTVLFIIDQYALKLFSHAWFYPQNTKSLKITLYIGKKHANKAKT